QAPATASHTYQSAGTYTVTVTVKDTGGLSSTATKSVTVSAGHTTLIANPGVERGSTASHAGVRAGATVKIGSAARPIWTYSYDFGDGSAATGPQASATASHTYQSAGTFTVTVTVKDTGGLSSTATKSVTVSAGQTNLIGNPGFESGLTGWNAGGRAGVTF